MYQDLSKAQCDIAPHRAIPPHSGPGANGVPNDNDIS
jgi:hypothetical protein